MHREFIRFVPFADADRIWNDPNMKAILAAKLTGASYLQRNAAELADAESQQAASSAEQVASLTELAASRVVDQQVIYSAHC